MQISQSLRYTPEILFAVMKYDKQSFITTLSAMLLRMLSCYTSIIAHFYIYFDTIFKFGTF